MKAVRRISVNQPFEVSPNTPVPEVPKGGARVKVSVYDEEMCGFFFINDINFDSFTVYCYCCDFQDLYSVPPTLPTPRI